MLYIVLTPSHSFLLHPLPTNLPTSPASTYIYTYQHQDFRAYCSSAHKRETKAQPKVNYTTPRSTEYTTNAFLDIDLGQPPPSSGRPVANHPCAKAPASCHGVLTLLSAACGGVSTHGGGYLRAQPCCAATATAEQLAHGYPSFEVALEQVVNAVEAVEPCIGTRYIV